jgi:hypothetical protein
MWYAYACIGVLVLALLVMPKYLAIREMYFSAGIIGFTTWVGDVLVGDVFQAFQIGPSPKTYFIDLVFVTIVPPVLGLVFLNFLVVIKTHIYKWIWVGIALLGEWGAVASGYMVDKGWRTWYSIPVFIFVFVFFLPWHLKVMRGEQRDVLKHKLP